MRAPSRSTNRRDVTVGTFIYDSSVRLDIDDRVLAHLQVVVGQKLRRQESFYFTWHDPGNESTGRVTVWIHPAVPLAYEYPTNEPATLDREWLEQMMRSANSTPGLHLTPTPTAVGDLMAEET